VAKQQSREQILQSLIDPSKVIDEKFKTWVVETIEGRVHTGLLDDKTPQEVVLRDAQSQAIRIPADRVESMAAQAVSLMPTMLLRDLTAQQAADLLAYLATLK
jgi:putative heme-binding domain-containing protein